MPYLHSQLLWWSSFCGLNVNSFGIFFWIKNIFTNICYLFNLFHLVWQSYTRPAKYVDTRLCQWTVPVSVQSLIRSACTFDLVIKLPSLMFNSNLCWMCCRNSWNDNLRNKCGWKRWKEHKVWSGQQTEVDYNTRPTDLTSLHQCLFSHFIKKSWPNMQLLFVLSRYIHVFCRKTASWEHCFTVARVMTIRSSFI